MSGTPAPEDRQRTQRWRALWEVAQHRTVKPWNIYELVAKTGMTPETVSGAMATLVRQGRMEYVARGVYRMTQQARDELNGVAFIIEPPAPAPTPCSCDDLALQLLESLFPSGVPVDKVKLVSDWIDLTTALCS